MYGCAYTRTHTNIDRVTNEATLCHMPRTTILRARVDTTRKARAEKILGRYGLSPAQAINVFYAKVTEANGLPFDLRPTEFQKHLAKMKAGKVRYVDADQLPA
jgi:addiction module RelB/DinJ family antitoxin